MPATAKLTRPTEDAAPMKAKRRPKATGWVLPLPRKHKGKIPLKVIRAAVRKAIAELRAEMAAKGIVLKPWRPEDADENGEVIR